MTENARDQFLSLSAALTGFTLPTLTFAMQDADFYARFDSVYTDKLTDLITAYQAHTDAGLTPDAAAAAVLDTSNSTDIAETARALIIFWYLGQIGSASNPMDLHVASSNFFAQGLAWRAVQAHPPGVSTLPFGHWASVPPPLSEFL